MQGYYEYVKQLLEPLRLYDLENGAGAEELRVIGGQLDGIFLMLAELCGEMLPITAEDFGLSLYEKLLPFRPAYLTNADKRRALISLMRIRGGCFTLALLQETVSGCGLKAIIEEGGTPLTVCVSFPENRGVPTGFEKLKSRVEEIVPCHLAVEYIFVYTIWREIMEKLPCWEALESGVDCWGQLEIYF